MRRLFGFYLTGEILGEFCRNGNRSFQVNGPVPETATFWSSYFDHGRNCFVVIFEDESFSLVPEGSPIPIGYGPQISDA